MIFEGVGFNDQLILAFKDAHEFASHKRYQTLWPQLSDDDRYKRLCSLYELLKSVNEDNQ